MVESVGRQWQWQRQRQEAVATVEPKETNLGSHEQLAADPASFLPTTHNHVHHQHHHQHQHQHQHRYNYVVHHQSSPVITNRDHHAPISCPPRHSHHEPHTHRDQRPLHLDLVHSPLLTVAILHWCSSFLDLPQKARLSLHSRGSSKRPI